jgi:hypothetical protein
MTLRSLLCLGAAVLVWPTLAAADVVDCSLSQARVDVSRLDIDNGSSLLLHQEDLGRFYPDRALRMGVSGTVLLACAKSDQGMDCVVREATPIDQNFESRSLRLMALVPRRLRDTAIFRVDYTILAVGTCFDPFHRVPDWPAGRARRR